MTKTLRIEVTPELVNAVVIASGVTILEYEQWEVALTAAFQHPEFVRQVREQVTGCVPGRVAMRGDADAGFNQANDIARANLAGLLGEEHG